MRAVSLTAFTAVMALIALGATASLTAANGATTALGGSDRRRPSVEELLATDPNLRQMPAAKAATYPPIVGTSFVGRGFDVTTFVPGLAQITDNTYTMGMTWTNPQNGKTYKVPDDMFAQTMSFSSLTNDTQSFDGVLDFQQWAQHTSHWHSGFLGIVSNSKTTYNYIKRYYRDDQSMAVTNVKVEFLELTAPTFPPLTLDPVFRLSVERLPAACETDSDYKLFQEFFQSYGTAFMDSATLGGRLEGQTWYAKCLLNVTSKSWVSQQSSWSVLGLIGGGHGHKGHDGHVNQAFKNCNTQDFNYYGGNATNLAPDDYARWITSTFDAPFPVSFTLQPLHSLVQDAAKANVMATALTRYLTEAQSQLNAQEAENKKHDPHTEQSCCREVHASLLD